MRYAILSDIHSNLAAFRAVLADMVGRRIDEVWCIGDTVGYGPYPNECLDLLKEQKHVCVAGNHDWGSAGLIDISAFHREAAFACQWTGTVLTAENMEYLKTLPETIEREDFTFAHGSPRRPLYEYVLSAAAAKQNLEYFKTSFCLVGHSHYPSIYQHSIEAKSVFRHLEAGEEIMLDEGRYIINTGSVGQPRDGDPRGSYAVFDSGARKITLYRIPYDIAQTQQRMRSSGLPHYLAERLSLGQ